MTEEHLVNVDIRNSGDLRWDSPELSETATQSLLTLKEKNCPGREWTGWVDWPENKGFQLLSHIIEWKNDLHQDWDCVVVCGIGGSFAGTKAVDDAFRHTYLSHSRQIQNRTGHLPIYYAGNNLSEKNLSDLLEALNAHQPMLCVISKSGTTTEPGVAFRVLRSYFEMRFSGSASERIIAITDSESGSLRDLANEKKYRQFPIPGDIGGRFSVFTAVGLVPLALAGYDISELLGGADQVFKSLSREDCQSEHPVLKLAAFRKAAWDAGKTVDIMSYREPGLKGLVEWWKQLFGESEGKQGKGLFPASMLYSTDLHSLGQFLQDGNPCMIQTFLNTSEYNGSSESIEKRVKVPHSTDGKDGLSYLAGRYIDEINQAAMSAGMDAHGSRGVPCIEIKVRKTDLWTLGGLLAFFQASCAVSALMLNVNPFDQPGVEAYKKNMFKILGKPGS